MPADHNLTLTNHGGFGFVEMSSGSEAQSAISALLLLYRYDSANSAIQSALAAAKKWIDDRLKL